jgi:hypothetical protein
MNIKLGFGITQILHWFSLAGDFNHISGFWIFVEVEIWLWQLFFFIEEGISYVRDRIIWKRSIFSIRTEYLAGLLFLHGWAELQAWGGRFL